MSIVTCQHWVEQLWVLCMALTSDGIVGSGVVDHLAVNHERLGRELPESLAGIHSSVSQLALELGVIDGAEFVGAGGVVGQVGSEDGLVEVGHDVIEEGLLLLWLDGVDLAKGKTHESISVGVLDERLGNSGGHLNGLLGDSSATNVNGVKANVAGGTATIAVGDEETGTIHGLEGSAFGGIESSMAANGTPRKLGAEDPEVTAARVEVQVEGLAADLHGRQEEGLVLLGVRGDFTALVGSVGGRGRSGSGGAASPVGFEAVLAHGLAHGHGAILPLDLGVKVTGNLKRALSKGLGGLGRGGPCEDDGRQESDKKDNDTEGVHYENA